MDGFVTFVLYVLAVGGWIALGFVLAQWVSIDE